jgi:predicted NACHT family NTPase
MALAIKLDGLVRQRVVPDYAALARLGHVSRARVAQIMNLLLLAPDIQEQLLFLPETLHGRDAIHLRQLQPIALLPDWSAQRPRWRRLLACALRTERAAACSRRTHESGPRAQNPLEVLRHPR